MGLCLEFRFVICRRIGFDCKQGESHLDALLRGELFATLAMFGHEETLREASRRFQAFLEDRNTHLLPPDIRRVNLLFLIYYYHLYICVMFTLIKTLFLLLSGCLCCCDEESDTCRQIWFWFTFESLQRDWFKSRKDSDIRCSWILQWSWYHSWSP